MGAENSLKGRWNPGARGAAFRTPPRKLASDGQAGKAEFTGKLFRLVNAARTLPLGEVESPPDPSERASPQGPPQPKADQGAFTLAPKDLVKTKNPSPPFP